MNIYFLNAEQLFFHLIQDQDQFYHRFNKNDLLARNCNSISDYMDMIYESIYNFSEQEINIMKKLIKEINNLKWPCDSQVWIDPIKFNQLDWVIGGVQGKKYESGLPHTRSHVIIIPKDWIQDSLDFKNTLLHEKLHVYQKSYPEEFESFLKKNEWKIVKNYNQCSTCRSNPDTNHWIYKKNKQTHVARYTSNPKSVMDVTYYPINFYGYEHPAEKCVLDLIDIVMTLK